MSNDGYGWGVKGKCEMGVHCASQTRRCATCIDASNFISYTSEDVAYQPVNGDNRAEKSHTTTSRTNERGHILREAITVINGERLTQYGAPEDSFKIIAEYWSTYLKYSDKLKGGTKITPRNVAQMMVHYKEAREINQHKEDNLIDAAGYLGIMGDMIDEN